MKEEAFLRSLRQKISTDLTDLLSTPLHASKIRDWVALTNIIRLQLTLSKLLLKQSLVIAHQLKWLDKLDTLFGTHIDLDSMLSRLDKPNGVFNALSVGVFVARFIIQAGLLLKHTFVPSSDEKLLTRMERFSQELNKRHCDLLNDLVWGTVNGLSNYAPYFNISAPVANWLMVGFLLFDLALLLYRLRLAEQDYLVKKEQYLSEKKICEDQARLNMLDEQLAQLELNWQVTHSTFCFNAGAAVLLMSGFSASLLLASSVMAPVGFFVCAIAISMYLSADLYGKYYEKSLMFQAKKDAFEDSTEAARELQAARCDFMVAMTKNTAIPMIIMATFAVSWPAALVFTVLYLGYECGKGYFNQPNKLPSHEERDEVPELGDQRLTPTVI